MFVGDLDLVLRPCVRCSHIVGDVAIDTASINTMGSLIDDRRSPLNRCLLCFRFQLCWSVYDSIDRRSSRVIHQVKGEMQMYECDRRIGFRTSCMRLSGRQMLESLCICSPVLFVNTIRVDIFAYSNITCILSNYNGTQPIRVRTSALEFS